MNVGRSAPRKSNWLHFFSSSSGAVVQTLFAKLFLLAANLATGIIVARVLAPVGRGEQAAMNLWPGLLCGLFTVGVPLALNYSSRRFPERRADYLFTAIILGVILGCFATVVGIAIIPYMLKRYDPSVIFFAQWFMLITPFAMLTAVLQAALESRSDFTASNLSKSLPQLATLVALIGLVLLGRLTPFSSTSAYILPTAVVPLILAYHLRRDIVVKLHAFRDSAKQLLSYGVRSYAVDILGTLSLQVDQLLVVGLLSASQLGLYVVALSVSRVLNVLSNSIVMVLFPKVAALETSDVVLLTGRAARISTFLTAAASLCLILALPFLMVRLYGGAFKSVVPVAQILCVELIIGSTTAIFAQAFMATGRPGTIALLQLLGLALTVPLMLLLIPRFGLNGAALALLLSSTCRLLTTIACYPALLGARIPSLLLTFDDIAFVRTRLSRIFNS